MSWLCGCFTDAARDDTRKADAPAASRPYPANDRIRSDVDARASQPASLSVHEVCPTPQHMVRDIDGLTYISRGASSIVFFGTWQSAEVAVKFLSANFSAKSASVREALLGTELAHPNLVQCYTARCVTLEDSFLKQALAASSGGGSSKPAPSLWRSSFDSEDGF
ncbi:hypothetical protein QJQ45_023395, partial [Haematococcus lacustris]